MNAIKKESSIFWEQDENGKLKVVNTTLFAFLECQGFANAKVSETDTILVRMINNRMSEVDELHVDQTISEHLMKKQEWAVFEMYARNMGSFIHKRKLNLLKSIELVNDRDKADCSHFYFLNCFCEITKERIDIHGYQDLQWPIWENRILKSGFNPPEDQKIGQFERFCKNITGKTNERFLALKTIIGYLLHRNKEVGEAKAIILYDEKMGQNNQAHGGTGKTLLSKAISMCREVAIFDGKEVKIGSWFKNQRIEITTDVLVYDDLNKGISLESFYSMITSGIEVEKKRRQAYYIKFEDSPKILITSNYYVKGPGGASDERRRHEFELSNHYDARFTPETEFGNRFFENSWDKVEWHKFYYFMMGCVQEYLKYGLITSEPINLDMAELNENTCAEFIKFADEYVMFNTWQNKREFQESFEELNNDIEAVSPHIFKKWLNQYAISKNGELLLKPSGGKYFFNIRKEVQDA
jgi:hypothetical protein